MDGTITSSGLRDFTVRCLTNRWVNGGATADIVAAHWAAAKDLDAFRAAIFGDPRLMCTQAYAELSKDTSGHWGRVREMFGARCIKTMSDAGGVKIGSGAFSVCIGNGRGDGVTRVAVFQAGDSFNPDMMEDAGVTVSGTLSIYDHDCGGEPVATLSGNYSVYRYAGLVAFVQF